VRHQAAFGEVGRLGKAGDRYVPLDRFADLGSDGLTAQERDAESKASLEVGELFSWLWRARWLDD